MTRKERVRQAIAGIEPDKIPYSFDLTDVIRGKIAGHYGISPWDVQDFIGDCLLYDWAGNASDFVPKLQDGDLYDDELGVVWNKSDKTHSVGDWGGIVSHPLKEASLKGYRFPDTKKPKYFHRLDAEALRGSGRYTVLSLTGLFDLGWLLRGFEDLLMDFLTEEAFVCELLDHALEYNLGLIAQAPDCFDGIRFGEDWGQQKGLIMGASLWRKYLKPRLRIMYEAAKKRGFHVLIHTCGDIYEIFPDIIDIGVEVVNPIQPEVMDVEKIKREFGKDIVLYGGMGCQSTLPMGSADDVLAEAKRRIEVLGKGGKYIFGPAGAIPTDAKIENVIALIDFLKSL